MESASHPHPLFCKTSAALGFGLLLALAVHFATPFLPDLLAQKTEWLPASWSEVLPGAFLPQTEAPPEKFADVDEEALLELSLEIETPDPLPQTAPAPSLPSEEYRPPTEGLQVESNGELPPKPQASTNAAGVTVMPIEDPQGAMTRFYRALQISEAAQKKGEPDRESITRIVHYGDSLLTGDYVTDQVRRLMQRKFGDAGHGFVLAGKPAPWYHRAHLSLSTSSGWTVHRLTSNNIADGWYGLGGATFLTSARGQTVRVQPTGDDLGQAVTRFQVFYASQPKGGKFLLQVDNRSIEVDTRSDEKASRLAEIQVADGAHSLMVKTLGGGEVRLFGVALEREGPGVVYDTLGMDGARAKHLKNMNPEHWHDQLRLREPDLLVLHYGTNESGFDLRPDKYAAELAQTVGHLRQALPGVSCLLISPMDRAYSDHGKLKTMPIVPKIVDAQRKIAYAQGCAFWNAFEAMGGEGSMVKWYRAGLGGGDLTHPTKKGADRMGAMLFATLMDGYSRFLAAHAPKK